MFHWPGPLCFQSKQRLTQPRSRFPNTNLRTNTSSMILQMTLRRDWMARHSSWICPAPGGELALVEAEEGEVEATDQPVEALLLVKD